MTDLEEYVGVEVPEHFPAEWAKGDDRPARGDGMRRLRIVRKGVEWHTRHMPRSEAYDNYNHWKARSRRYFVLMSTEHPLWTERYRKLELMEVVK